MNTFLFILTNNIIPIFILVILGYILDKNFNLDVHTLSKLNFYVFVPAFMFINLYKTEIPFDMLKVSVLVFCLLLINMVISFAIAKMRAYDEGLKNIFANSIMFYNTGNIGLLLITLVFSNQEYCVNGDTPYLSIALTAHIMVLLIQTITQNTIGFFYAGRTDGNWKESLLKVFKMPTVYVIPLTLLLKFIPYDISKTPIWDAAYHASLAMIAIALLSLGIQLSRINFSFKNKDMFISVFVRLLIGPFIAVFLINIFNIEGIIAQVVMITSALPTAVNTALIAIEYDNHPDFASQTVMASTLLSSISLVFVIYVAGLMYPIC